MTDKQSQRRPVWQHYIEVEDKKLKTIFNVVLP